MAIVDSTRVIVALALGASGCADRVAEPSDAAQTSGAESSSGSTGAVSTGDVTTEGDATTTGTTNAADSTTGGALACAEAEDAEDYVASLMLWEQARDDAANTYWFIGERGTVTGGGGLGALYACLYQTLVVVENGQVVERTMYDGEPVTDEDECEPGWTEIGSEVGTHDARSEDAPVPPWNLDETYASCCEEVLTMEGRYDRASFYPHDDGLLHRCFWSSSSKATHAPPGWGDEIRIAEVGFGEPPQ